MTEIKFWVLNELVHSRSYDYLNTAFNYFNIKKQYKIVLLSVKSDVENRLYP